MSSNYHTIDLCMCHAYNYEEEETKMSWDTYCGKRNKISCVEILGSVKTRALILCNSIHTSIYLWMEQVF